MVAAAVGSRDILEMLLQVGLTYSEMMENICERSDVSTKVCIHH